MFSILPSVFSPMHLQVFCHLKLSFLALTSVPLCIPVSHHLQHFLNKEFLWNAIHCFHLPVTINDHNIWSIGIVFYATFSWRLLHLWLFVIEICLYITYILSCQGEGALLSFLPPAIDNSVLHTYRELRKYQWFTKVSHALSKFSEIYNQDFPDQRTGDLWQFSAFSPGRELGSWAGYLFLHTLATSFV